ncbi:other aur protein kinase [Cyclospora cayetanensis]|uniref:Other aur protein kinase n=1 Tax=Cyclospora cayetanensis TaxID=88456 RepID=A0A1D3D5N9_9EIME|nr:other aur protein kinase [Cyclospora cayetanensis]
MFAPRQLHRPPSQAARKRSRSREITSSCTSGPTSCSSINYRPTALQYREGHAASLRDWSPLPRAGVLPATSQPQQTRTQRHIEAASAPRTSTAVAAAASAAQAAGGLLCTMLSWLSGCSNGEEIPCTEHDEAPLLTAREGFAYEEVDMHQLELEEFQQLESAAETPQEFFSPRSSSPLNEHSVGEGGLGHDQRQHQGREQGMLQPQHASSAALSCRQRRDYCPPYPEQQHPRQLSSGPLIQNTARRHAASDELWLHEVADRLQQHQQQLQLQEHLRYEAAHQKRLLERREEPCTPLPRSVSMASSCADVSSMSALRQQQYRQAQEFSRHQAQEFSRHQTLRRQPKPLPPQRQGLSFPQESSRSSSVGVLSRRPTQQQQRGATPATGEKILAASKEVVAASPLPPLSAAGGPREATSRTWQTTKGGAARATTAARRSASAVSTAAAGVAAGSAPAALGRTPPINACKQRSTSTGGLTSKAHTLGLSRACHTPQRATMPQCNGSNKNSGSRPEAPPKISSSTSTRPASRASAAAADGGLLPQKRLGSTGLSASRPLQHQRLPPLPPVGGTRGTMQTGESRVDWGIRNPSQRGSREETWPSYPLSDAPHDAYTLQPDDSWDSSFGGPPQEEPPVSVGRAIRATGTSEWGGALIRRLWHLSKGPPTARPSDAEGSHEAASGFHCKAEDGSVSSYRARQGMAVRDRSARRPGGDAGPSRLGGGALPTQESPLALRQRLTVVLSAMLQPRTHLEAGDFVLCDVTLGYGRTSQVVLARCVRGPLYEQLVGEGGGVQPHEAPPPDPLVALKVLPKAVISRLGMREQVRRERALHASVQHPNILRFFGSFEDPGHLVFVLQYANRGTLRHRMREAGGHLPEEEMARYTAQVASALAHLHANNIIHRDVKPENILVHKQRLSGELDAVLGDFGFCSSVGGREKRQTFCGTVSCLKGSHPINAPQSQLQPQENRQQPPLKFVFEAYFSSDARDLITKMCTEDPDERITASEVLRHPWILRHVGALCT